MELGRLPETYLQTNSRETPNWKMFLPAHLTKQPPFDGIPAALLEQALAQGRCLLLCDGLDEIADLSARRRLADSLADYARSSANRLVLSSRPAGVSGSEASLGARFQRLTIQRLAPEDVRHFFVFIYAQNSELTPDEASEEADRLYAVVESQPKTLELATTPLLATLLLLLWNQDGYLPERRVELYERCCQMLIESWEAQHDVAYTGVLAEIGWERHLRLLAPLAYAIHNTGQRTDAPASELIPVLAQAMQVEGLASPASATLEAEKFLRTLSLRSGLLQFLGVGENGEGRYGFPHLTFQEYLSARHIAAQPDPDYIDTVMVHLHKAWWREVHLLVIGHLGSGSEGAQRASKLLFSVLSVNQKPLSVLLFQPKLRRIGRVVPNWQLSERISWVLFREFEMASSGSIFESTQSGMTTEVKNILCETAGFLLLQVVQDFQWHEILSTRGLFLFFELMQCPDVFSVENALLHILENSEGSTQALAARSLGYLGQKDAYIIDGLVGLLLSDSQDPHGVVRYAAAESLLQLDVVNCKVVQTVVQGLSDSDWAVRIAAIDILGRFVMVMSELDSFIIQASDDDAILVRERVANSLGNVKSEIPSVLLTLRKLLGDPFEGVRQAAADSLVNLGQTDSEVITVLLDVLNDPNDIFGRVSQAARDTLSKIHPIPPEMMDRLFHMLDPDNHRLFEHIAGIFWGSDPIPSDAATAFAGFLEDPNILTRQIAASVLIHSDFSVSKSVDCLMLGLSNEDWRVRGDAAERLGLLKHPSPKVIQALSEALHDEDIDVLQASASSLVQLGQTSEEVVSALVEALADSAWDVRAAAAESLGQLKIEDEAQLRTVLIALNRRLHDRDDDVRRAALTAIRRLLDGRQIPGYRWVPIREQQRRVRIRKRIGWAVLGLGLVLSALCIGGVANGQLDFADGWVRVVGGLAGLASLAAGVDLWLTHRRRPPWDR